MREGRVGEGRGVREGEVRCGCGATDDKLLMVPRAKNAHHSARKDAMATG